MEHLQRLPGINHRAVQPKLHQAADKQHDGHHHEHIAQNGSYLRAHKVRDLVHKLDDSLTRTQVPELRRHGGCGHGRLFGSQREMQQLNQHEAGGIHHAGQKSAPEGGQRQRHHSKLQQRGERRQGAATGRFAQHVDVGDTVARDVVLAGFGAALRNLGSQQCGVGGNQRAYAASLFSQQHQPGQQLHRADSWLFS